MSASPFPQEHHPPLGGESCTPSGDMPRYAAGLHDFGGGVFAWLQPNGGWGESNAGLIAGHGASLLVDTLWDLGHTRRMLDGLGRPLAAAPIRRVVNTHSDGDHWWGNQLVAAEEVIATEAAARVMAHDTPAQMRALGRVTRLCHGLSRLPFPAGWREHWRTIGDYFAGMMSPFDFGDIRPTPATSTFSGTLRLTVGGREVELIEVGPAHTAGDLVVHVPDARTVFSGDVLFLGSTPVLWEGSVGNWLAALDRIQALDVDRVVPGHGPPGDRGSVEAFRNYWTYLESAARRRFGEGYSVTEAAHDIVRSDDFRVQPFARWDCPERIVINVHALYRQFAGKPSRMSPLERLKVMRQTALLSREFPGASPAAPK